MLRKNGVENHEPDVGKNNAANQVGKEKGGSEHIGSPNSLRQSHGNCKCNNVDDQHGHHGKQGGVPK